MLPRDEVEPLVPPPLVDNGSIGLPSAGLAKAELGLAPDGLAPAGLTKAGVAPGVGLPDGLTPRAAISSGQPNSVTFFPTARAATMRQRFVQRFSFERLPHHVESE